MGGSESVCVCVCVCVCGVCVCVLCVKERVRACVWGGSESVCMGRE